MRSGATTAVQPRVALSTQLGVGLLKVTFRTSFILTLGVIALVGLWAMACLVGGLVSAGGPFELARGWFSAVTGL